MSMHTTFELSLSLTCHADPLRFPLALHVPLPLALPHSPFHPMRYAARGITSRHFLAAPQPMEWLDFSSETGLSLKTTRVCTFVTTRGGHFDGLHLHLLVALNADTTIDTHAERTSWTCTYVRLFDAASAIWLAAGSRIECICDADLSSDCPEYAIRVSVANSEQESMQYVASFTWRGDG